MAPVAPVIATINRRGVTPRSISPKKGPKKSEGHRVSDAPNLRRRPGSPSSRHLPRFQVDDAPITIASGGPSKMLRISSTQPSEDSHSVSAITKLSTSPHLQGIEAPA